jgi:hypothetical protein
MSNDEFDPIFGDDSNSNFYSSTPSSPSSRYSQQHSSNNDTDWAKPAEKESTIGVWGGPGTGKTIYLASAIYALRVRLGIHGNQGYDIFPRPGISLTEFNEANRFLTDVVGGFAGGNIPQANIHLTPFALSIGYQNNSFFGREGHYNILDILDSMGEYSRELDATHTYWQHLRNTRGIIFIIDGKQKNGSYQQIVDFGNIKISYTSLISNFVNIMRLADPLPYLAIVITKCDTHTNITNWRDLANAYPTDESKEDLLYKIIGDDYSLLKNTFKKRYKIFTTSSVGWYEDEDGVLQRRDTNQGKIEIADKHIFTSYHTAYSLLWLLDRIESQKRRKLPLWRQTLQTLFHKSNVSILKEAYQDMEKYLP